MKKSSVFERYLLGLLNNQELLEFKAKLNEDPEFNREFQRLKEIRYAVRYNARLEIRTLLDAAESKVTPSKKSTKRKNSIKKIAALIVVVAALLTVIFTYDRPTKSTLELFLQHYSSPTLEEIIPTTVFDLSSQESSALLAYQSGNFESASQSLIRLSDSLQQAEIFMLSGISAMETKNYDLAIDQFNIIINQFDKYVEQALWYTALSWLALDKKTEALCSFFQLKLIEDTGYNSEEVLEALGVDLRSKASLGIVESFVVSTDSSSSLSPLSAKGILNDLTTRSKYEFYLIQPKNKLAEGQILSYLPLELVNDVNGLGVAFLIEPD